MTAQNAGILLGFWKLVITLKKKEGVLENKNAKYSSTYHNRILSVVFAPGVRRPVPVQVLHCWEAFRCTAPPGARRERYVMLRCVKSRHVMSRHGMSCHAFLAVLLFLP